MKSEKLSTEIAALERKIKSAKNAVVKKVLEKKIETLRSELKKEEDGLSKLAKAKKKIREMSEKDFNEFIKMLSKKDGFAFLKSMTKDEIKRDIKREAKPVGWRFRGDNTKKPTRRDIREKNDVYYEGRRNRSDVSRAIKLAKGGGVEHIEVVPISDDGNFYILLNDDSKKWYSQEDITKIPNIYFASGFQDPNDEGVAFVHYDNALRPVYKANGQRADKMSKYAGMSGSEIKANGGGVGEREEGIKKLLKGKKHPISLDELKEMSKKTGYSAGDIEYVFQKMNDDLQYNPKYAKGGVLKEGDYVWNQIGKKLVVNKVTDNEYYLVGFGQPFPNSWSKSVVDDYISNGKWTLKPKYENGGVSEQPIGMMKPITGKVVGSVPVSEQITSSEVKDFVEYVYEVYKDEGYTKAQVRTAVNKYINDLGKEFTYGGGDSLDRERVYEYLLNPKLSEIKNPSFENGGSLFDEPHRSEMKRMMAKGGAIQHGLQVGDKIVADQFWENSIVVENGKTNKRAIVYLETGKRKEA